MKFAVMVGSILFIFSTCLYAQQSLVGKYSGSLTAPDGRGNPRQQGISIEITSAENGSLKGTITNAPTVPCYGTYAMEGTYDGNKVILAAVEAASTTRGCVPLRFQGVAEGNRLVGKMPWNGAPRDLTVSK